MSKKVRILLEDNGERLRITVEGSMGVVDTDLVYRFAAKMVKDAQESIQRAGGEVFDTK